MIRVVSSPFAPTEIDDRFQQVIDLHMHARHGSEFWIQRANELGVQSRDLKSLDDLSVLGMMSPTDLQSRPLRHFVPRSLHRFWHRMIVGQTGGTTGHGAWTAYFEDEFHNAFIAPFSAAAGHTSFSRQSDWLYIGPSGPHVIGKVVRELARSVGSADPFSVDFDPRWAKKLPPDSLAFSRYFEHVIEQAMAVIANQSVEVLFTTPAVLHRLASRMSQTQRSEIRGVHYGGMALANTDLAHFQRSIFPNAVHLSGYGNTLFGCCMEISAAPDRELDYYPFGDRLLFEVLDDQGHPLEHGSTGQVCFTRLDQSMLIVRMRERDEAMLLPPPLDAPAGFRQCGVRNPHSPQSLAPNQRPGLY